MAKKTARQLFDAVAAKDIAEKTERQNLAASAKINDLRLKLGKSYETIAKLERTLEVVCGVDEGVTSIPRIIVPKSKTNEAIPLFTWSDWHLDEKIDPRKVLNLNEFDATIARRRAEQCIESTVKLIRHIREANHVSSISILLGGDFITGDIHEELSETNTMGPAEAVVFATQLLSEGLQALSEEKYLKNIHVSCVVGNHGRTTKKMRYKNGTEKSFETIIYHFLKKQFNTNQFKWSICAGGVNYTSIVPGFVVRDFHGHQVKFEGGIGGVTIPLNKWIHRQDQSQRADYNRMCHYHSFSTPNTRTLLCGSLKGWDEYAAEHGFPYEPPTQACAVFDTVRKRISGIFPVFCEANKK